MKLFRRSHRVLTRHRIGHEKNFDRMGLALDLDQLFHQLIVDVQASGRINQERVIAESRACFKASRVSSSGSFVSGFSKIDWPVAFAMTFNCSRAAGR